MTEKKFEAISVPSPPPCQSWSNTTAPPSPSLGYERRGGEVEMCLRATSQASSSSCSEKLGEGCGKREGGAELGGPLLRTFGAVGWQIQYVGEEYKQIHLLIWSAVKAQIQLARILAESQLAVAELAAC